MWSSLVIWLRLTSQPYHQGTLLQTSSNCKARSTDGIPCLTHGILARRTEGPDVPVLTIPAPGGFVAVQDRAGPRLMLERIDVRLECVPHLMQLFHHLARY